MDLKYIFLIVILIGVIFLSIKIAELFFRKKNANKKKKEEITSNINAAFETHSARLEQISKDYDELQSKFDAYISASQKALATMEEYSDRAVAACVKIVDMDKQFEEKLNLWCELLNDPNNSANVQKQIQEHIQHDIKLRAEVKQQQEAERMARNERVRKYMGLKL